MTNPRLETGIGELDVLLGGGLLPGTLTVVLGATGIGKTQLGIQFAHNGLRQEGEPGILFDMTTRGDSQRHREYARSLFGWELSERDPERPLEPETVWDGDAARVDAVHVFRQDGRRVHFRDLEPEDWREWKVELARKLERTIHFFYGNFVHGVRRCVIDGIEPAERDADSFQWHLFEYLYHQVLRKKSDWVARDLFRARFRENAGEVERHEYDHGEIGCLLLATSHEVLLDDLLDRPVQSGDLLSNANTIIVMGKTRDGSRTGRALCVAKHRGSACDGRIAPFEITGRGIELD